MKNADSHVIFYAKGHYVTTDLWADLAKILAERNALDVSYFTKELIFENMVHITMNYVSVCPSSLANFIIAIQPNQMWKWSDKNIKEYDFYEAAVTECLHILRFLTVRSKDDKIILELDTPDENILPITYLSRKLYGNKENEDI